MTNNFFSFGDTTWHQQTGTAMGTPPAPPYATIYFAIREETLLEHFAANLFLYRRFIDDVLGAWTITDPATDDATWERFQQAMNDDDFEIEWDINARTRRVNFMDLTITLDDNNRFSTTLFEKALNLHLYIPPHSAHPPGVLNGLVMGMLYRINTLCTDSTDIEQKTRQFFRRLRARGYQSDKLLPLFRKAIARFADSGETQQFSPSATDPTQQIFFHVRYHPNDPPSRELQRTWRETIAKPAYTRPFAAVRNHAGQPINIDRMIVCYSRPSNLGNLLSYRKIDTANGPPVSSYRITSTGAAERERERERARESMICLLLLLLLVLVPATGFHSSRIAANFPVPTGFHGLRHAATFPVHSNIFGFCRFPAGTFAFTTSVNNSSLPPMK